MKRVWVVAIVTIAASCTAGSESGDTTLPAPNGTPNGTSIAANGPLVPAFAQRALEIAGEYVPWGRVDDELRWAPFLCRQPMPASAHVSDSSNAATHGQKLYS